MSRLRVGVVGAGHLGRIHAKLLSAMSEVELVGVADPVASAREQIAAACGVLAVADHRELLDQVQAAVIATPTRLHYGVALEFLRRGIHLLVEKPLSATVAEADDLVRVARRHGCLLQVGHVERFNPALCAAAPLLTAPKYIEAVRAAGYGRSTDIGVVHDLMIHDLDVILSLVRAPVRSVSALGLAILGRPEDVAQARLEFENGCVANLSASRVTFSEKPCRQMNVWSQHAFAAIDFGADSATVVLPSEEVTRREIDLESIGGADAISQRQQMARAHLRTETLAVTPTNKLADELKDFVDSIHQHREPRVNGEQARDALVVAERILNSIASHAWDGSPTGPVGPRVVPPVPILRGPHWRSVGQTAPLRREAG